MNSTYLAEINDRHYRKNRVDDGHSAPVGHSSQQVLQEEATLIGYPCGQLTTIMNSQR
jgi:hypothetical protein